MKRKKSGCQKGDTSLGVGSGHRWYQSGGALEFFTVASLIPRFAPSLTCSISANFPQHPINWVIRVPSPNKTPRQTADEVARNFFGVKDNYTKAQAIRQNLLCALIVPVLVPALFLLKFGEVGPLGWGTTVFFFVYPLLTALGLFFKDRTEYHTPISLQGGWLDRLGSFWLVACVFGPFLGWFFTTGTIPITLGSWQWLYGLRIFFAAVVPLILALPLTRYLSGKATLIALPLLIVITLLPISSAMNVSLDLWQGPQVQPIGNNGEPVMLLTHTRRVIS